MINKSSSEEFSTGDLSLAAFLKVKRFKLIRIDRENNGKGLFIFLDQPDRQKLIMSFLNGEESVEPTSYLEAQRNLKAACREN